MKLFIGLAPPDAVRLAIANERDARQKQLKGKASANSNLHMTLAFLGVCSAETFLQVHHSLAQLQLPRFSIQLDCVRHFQHGAIVWLGCQHTPAALLNLAAAVRTQLNAADVTFDPQPFVAHVTVLRKSQAIHMSLAQAITWPVDELVLYASEPGMDGPIYRPLHTYALS